ncbi:sigma-70 family RNA polymerase sigma factor [bacterium]|nr:sigma-70 family RNA polymerase sigma factor [bacterium]
MTTGSEAAWASFVDRYLPLIVSAIRRTLPHSPATDQEDIIQDIFVRLCQHDYRLLKSYNPDQSSLATWLTVVARGVAIDAHRRSVRRIKTEPMDFAPEPSRETPLREGISLPPGLLSPRESAILTLLFDQDCDVDEVADRLGIHPQTVRSTKHNALTKLRKHLGKSPGEPP